ncbi:LytR/AlgR family response regulator transcription factor [Mucilaginibacter paludis]|uniref:Two component transcriptional regulator, LytTR family n=1 Tax=Mucilaginibacter paludis DSM 18603 TaxID=714943 RepID=H1YCX0_9SPHI|nr:LytTR family DNA-binding domain-containing protein [Mucilaginibacter paludis]EHQ25141.1 two component transcriptional regulator, LytTR family [Mucilaginibacter paludis DSM 18603]
MKALRIAVVEDEAVTARNLAHLLQLVDGSITIAATLASVSEAVEWFNCSTDGYDLIMMDIRLADGLSFDIFKAVDITSPVIFVTAYNDYAIQAFKNNGIDYILKPFDEKEIGNALKKFRSLTGQPPAEAADNGRISQVLQQIDQLTRSYKKSFLVHFRDKLIPVETAKIAWFYTASELVYAHTTDGHQYVMEFTMEQLEQLLDPQLFFRANRQFIVNRGCITEVEFYFNGRLLVKVKPEPTERILISKVRTPEFKAWMNR